MTIDELKIDLEKYSISNDLYAIMNKTLPNEKLCLTEEEGKWKVYYSERGHKTGLKTFDTESEACEYFRRKIIRHSERLNTL